ncbi:hypothetical protein [uncultured Pedobacter sp.]|uniref:hypothetical protein n=1 Tax=uncultured Pedobacter sp. TaxID=246139 RepID=UPI0025E97C71|nr:hypothetical protein [uncultured Pedobacter sp.]
MGTSKFSVTSIEKAKQLHTQFPHEVHEFFTYLKLYITYNGHDNLVEKRLINYLDQYQEQMDSDALTFAYMLFQPSSARFVEHCILSYAIHSDSSTYFADYVKANYL